MYNYTTANPIDAVLPMSEKVSDKYHFISTRQAIDVLENDGWYVAGQQLAKTRKYEGYQKHIITMEHEGLPALQIGRPNMVLVNDHMGSSAYQMYLGINVYACLNGCVSGDVFGGIRVRHIGNGIKEKVLEASHNLLGEGQRFRDTIELMRDTTLDIWQAQVFAEKAAEIRWPSETVNGDKMPLSRADVLLVARRTVDQGNSLWQVYNRVQENLIRGGLPGYTTHGRRLHTRRIQSLSANLSINKKLFDLAMNYTALAN